MEWSIGDAIGSTMSALGHSVYIEGKLMSGFTLEKLSTEFPFKVGADGTFRVQLGQVALEESRSIQVTLLVPAREAQVDDDCGLKVTLRYEDILTRIGFSVDDVLRINRPESAATGGISQYRTAISIERERVRSEAVASFQKAFTAAEESDLEQVQTLMTHVKEVIRKSRAAHDPISLTILVDADSIVAIPPHSIPKMLLCIRDRHAMQRPAGCLGDAFGCGWRETRELYQLYQRVPASAMESFKAVTDSSRERGLSIS